MWMSSCHCVQGWPDGDTPQGCVHLGQVPVEPHVQVPPAFPGVVSASPSLCHVWLHWLGGEGLASAPLCLPMPCPASLPTCWGSWGQCCPPSLSINLLGKHSLEWGGLSVCPSMMVLPTGSHPGTADFLVQCSLLGCFSSPGLIAWMTAVQAGSCLGRLRGLCS